MKAAVWHYFYRHWYDNDRAGNARLARFWGWANDTACAIMWPKRKEQS